MFSHDSGRVERSEEGKFTFGDIVVLYRLNAQRHVLEEAFLRSGIPFQISGDKLHPVEHALDRHAEKVSLSTIHAVKGLEFAVVFMAGCEEHILPLQLEGLTSSVEEERRLFYVGITRAKDRLFMTYASERLLYGAHQHNLPSRFLNEIPSDLFENPKSDLVSEPVDDSFDDDFGPDFDETSDAKRL